MVVGISQFECDFVVDSHRAAVAWFVSGGSSYQLELLFDADPTWVCLGAFAPDGEDFAPEVLHLLAALHPSCLHQLFDGEHPDILEPLALPLAHHGVAAFVLTVKLVLEKQGLVDQGRHSTGRRLFGGCLL